ncbi:VWA domain-containing protein [Ruficoccus amylovorans]|uniref:VWA domain-containing protein n=1 Tax=Ruficoccus amylovorans TaxID=1804625 RepID=A0A842H8N6_9BACT|nr:VWA domain-containing protein [Ruficoccus amylovorans]MBC2592893.1 VWA domain-containing protein [Ruficoccus amylovorans]
MSTSLQFHNPELLWLLALLPVLILLRGRSGRNAAMTFSSVALARAVSGKIRTRAGAFLFFLRLLALAALIVAIARPQLGKGHSEIESSGIDIILAVDVSGSMRALDFATQDDLANRLDIVKRTISNFIEERPNDRIGMIAFAKEPFLVSPLTLNHEWLLKLVDNLKIGRIDETATAIGPAIGMASNRLRDLQAKSRIVILLTDGEDNVNKVPPVAAAEAAKAFGIKFYTIAAGSIGNVPMPRLNANGEYLRDRSGRIVYDLMRSEIDDKMLQEVADVTGGKFYHATNKDELAKIYDEIDQLEKTKVKLKHYSTYEELFLWPACLALGLIGLEQLLANTRFKRIP